MDTNEPGERLSGPVYMRRGKHTRGSFLDFGADQIRALQNNRLEIRNNPWAKLRAFD